MDRAMSRIEAALARIEEAARTNSPAIEDGSGGDAVLRDRVGAALAQLDELIDGLQR